MDMKRPALGKYIENDEKLFFFIDGENAQCIF